VRDAVEERFEVDIHHHQALLLEVAEHCAGCLLSTAPRTKAVAVLVEEAVPLVPPALGGAHFLRRELKMEMIDRPMIDRTEMTVDGDDCGR
jgi:hypothetical protein